jgi:hypothetical protein
MAFPDAVQGITHYSVVPTVTLLRHHGLFTAPYSRVQPSSPPFIYRKKIPDWNAIQDEPRGPIYKVTHHQRAFILLHGKSHR